DGELSDETVQKRQSDGRHGHYQKDGSVYRHDRGKTAELRNFTRVTPFVDDSYNQEESARGNAMIDLLQYAPVETIRIEREHPEHYKSHVADGRIGHQLFHVGVHPGHHGAVYDRNNRKRHHHRNKMLRGPRQDGQAEPQESVRSHLQQNAGEDNGSSS